MRVLQFGMSSNKGGVESFIYNYNLQMLRYGITFDYISMENRMAFCDEIIELGEKIEKVAYTNTHPLKSFVQLIKITKGYDVVHVNMLCAANIIPLAAARINRVKKIIAHSHNTNTEGLLRRVLHHLNKPLLRFLATDYLACGGDAAEWLFTKALNKKKKITIIHNAIDFEKYRYSEMKRKKIRKEFNIGTQTLLIGCVGRITLQKNIVFMADILKAALRLNKDVKLMLVGYMESGYDLKVKKRIQELGLSDYVIFTRERDDADWFYPAFDAFCMPSLYEGLSFTAVEAQASNVPCFFSDKMDKSSKIIPSVKFLGLDNPEIWAEAIINAEGTDRKADIKNMFIERGYDLETESEFLKRVYK